jgi:hypothetical protein
MSLSDPSHLLERIPELHALTGDQRIRRAIESGNSFKLYRTLIVSRLLRRIPEHDELLRHLIGNRRWFANPIEQGERVPSMFNFKSFGFGLRASSPKELDNSYLALRTLVMFNLPIMPLGAYVVKQTAPRKWEIFARAPLSFAEWLYTQTLKVGATVVAALGLGLVMHHYFSHELLIVNGFDVPVIVEIDHQTIRLAAQSKIAIALNSGPVKGEAHTEIRAKSGKADPVDSFDHVFSPERNYRVWNIAGAAPIVVQPVEYHRNATMHIEEQEEASILCGKRYIELANVKYAFAPLPKEYKMKGSEDRITINHVSIKNEATENDSTLRGVQFCIPYTFDRGLMADRAKMLEVQAALHDWDLGYSTAALSAAQSVSNKEAMRVAKRITETIPDDVMVERMIQDIRLNPESIAGMIEEYGARARAKPDDANEQYLYASLFSGVSGIAPMQELAQRFPKDRNILRSLVWRKAVHGDYSGASADLARLRKLSLIDVVELNELEVRILLAQGRGFDAMNVLNRLIRDKARGNRAGYAAQYGQIAVKYGVSPEIHLGSLPGDPNNYLVLDFYRARAGVKLIAPSHAQNPQIRVALALRDDPATALRLAKKLDRAQLNAFGYDQIALMYGEAIRVGDNVMVEKMRGMLTLTPMEESVFRLFVIGEAVSLDSVDIDIDIQAAANLVRSRNAQISPAERAALRARASDKDLLRGVVSWALRSW